MEQLQTQQPINNDEVQKDVMQQLLDAVNSLVKIAKKEPKKSDAIKKFVDDVKASISNHTFISKELAFTDPSNSKYEVIEKQAQYLDEHETFGDIARRGLDPNVNKNSEVYGVGRRLEPKNVTIARMKADIDLAGAELKKRKQAYAEYVAQLEQQVKETSEPQPTNEPKGDN